MLESNGGLTMRIARWLSLVALLGIIVAVDAQDPSEFARVRPTIEKKLKVKSAAVRIGALNDLRQYAFPDSARLVLSLSKDADPSVRQAVLTTLARLQTDNKVRAWMMSGLQKDFTDSNGILVGVLLSAEGERREVLDLVNKALKSKPVKLAAVMPGIAELGTWQDPAAVRALARWAQLGCFPNSLALQRGVAESLIGIRHVDTVPVLIDLTAKTEGEVLFQIGSHLNRITGEAYGVDTKAWQEWWRTNKASFQYPTPEALAAAKNKPAEAGASYYGIPICARRLIFIIDTSGSMTGARLDSAKKELVQAIEKLPDRAEFNILVFNTSLAIWNPKPVTATEKTKQLAIRFVNSLVAKGMTCTYDALRAALEMKVESIYLLTDGAPTNGQIVRPEEILVAVQGLNRLLGSSIHVIGIAPGPDDGRFSVFLKTLAEQNHGQYRKVD
jgi:hypothetical protein